MQQPDASPENIFLARIPSWSCGV